MMTTKEQVHAAADTFISLAGAHIAPYLEACVHCGQCAEACHFHEVTGDPRYTPAYKLFPIARAYRRARSPLNWIGLRHITTEAEMAEWEELIFDTCTMCGRCSTVCPMGIDIASIVAGVRTAYAAAGMGPPDLMQQAENVRKYYSPLKVTPDIFKGRLDWIEDEHDVVIPRDKKGAEVLLISSSINIMKYPETLAAMVKLLTAAKVDWTMSSTGYEASNYGYESGKEDVAKIGLKRVVDAAVALGVKSVIIPECGHAYSVMRWDGANLLGHELPYQVFHGTEYLAKLKREGKLHFKPIEDKVTYHDPCQVSRRGGAEADARELLSGFAPNFREMTPHGNYNWCCGGGGGVQSMGRAAELRHKVFEIKARQVEAAGADTLISACANCHLTLDESTKAMNWNGKLDSLVQMLAANLVEDKAA